MHLTDPTPNPTRQVVMATRFRGDLSSHRVIGPGVVEHGSSSVPTTPTVRPAGTLVGGMRMDARSVGKGSVSSLGGQLGNNPMHSLSKSITSSESASNSNLPANRSSVSSKSHEMGSLRPHYVKRGEVQATSYSGRTKTLPQGSELYRRLIDSDLHRYVACFLAEEVDEETLVGLSADEIVEIFTRQGVDDPAVAENISNRIVELCKNHTARHRRPTIDC